jgi:predicted anti-sigma-YlaC factor YlaD
LKEVARESTSARLDLSHQNNSAAQGSGIIEKEQLKQIEQMREYFSQFIEEYEEEEVVSEEKNSMDIVTGPTGSSS